MIYEAEVRKSLRNGKFFFILSRDGKAFAFGDARYLSRDRAVSAARRMAYNAHSRVTLQHLAAPVFRVRREHAARTVGPVGLVGLVGQSAEDGVLP